MPLNRAVAAIYHALRQKPSGADWTALRGVAVLLPALQVRFAVATALIGPTTSGEGAFGMDALGNYRSAMKGVTMSFPTVKMGFAKPAPFVAASAVGDGADTIGHVEPLSKVWPRPGSVSSTRPVLQFYRRAPTSGRR